MHRPTPIVRSVLSIPVLVERFVDKARDVDADVLVFDLEDSIAPAAKPRAREAARELLPGFNKGRRLMFARPNGLDSGLLEADLEALVGPWLDGIHLPKVHDARMLEQADHYLTLLERLRGMTPGSVKLIAWVESAQAVANVERLCRASARLIGVSMGAEDYATSLGVARSREGTEIEFARARTCNAARAAGLAPIDGPEPDFRDLDHFTRDIQHARALGYQGKFCIHPAQVPVANEVFAPNEQQIEWAGRVVEAYLKGEREGLGAVALDGGMIDRPIYERARELLDRHTRIARHQDAQADA